MSTYDLELLADSHHRRGFCCGKVSLDRYLRDTARGHLAKGVSVTRILVERNTFPPVAILGYFTLTTVLVEATNWPGVAKGLPRMPVPAVLLGRLAVAEGHQGKGIARLLLAAAREIAVASMLGTGGIGLLVDAGDEDVVGFYEKYGFKRVADGSLRLFLPTISLH